MARLTCSLAVRAAAAMLVAGLAGGCAHPRSFRCPAEGGPPWVEVESDHFLVKTDASEEAAESAARELETTRLAQLAAWDGALDPSGRLEVVVLRNQTELLALAGDFFVAGYYASTGRARIVAGLLDRDHPFMPPPQLWLDTRAIAEAEQRRVLRHELAHHLVGRVLLRHPRWLSEGLAEYLAGIRLGTWQGRPAAAVGLGDWETWRKGRVPAAGLLAWRAGQSGAHHYTASWLLVHWLVNRRGAAFAAYQQRLARAEDPVAAWKAEFPDLDPAEAAAMARLDRELDAYLASPSYTPIRVMLPPVEPRLRRRAMSSSEVHALRAEMFLQSPLPPERAGQAAEAEIAASLREDPSGLPLALTLAEVGRLEDALRLGRAAAAARPDDWRGWTMLASGARAREELAAERLAALRRAAPLLPDDAWALNEVAWGLLEAGASGEAFPLAARAARLAPGNASVLDTWGAILADVGRCPESLLAQRRAVDLLDERAAADAAREIRDRLARIEAQCLAAPPGP